MYSEIIRQRLIEERKIAGYTQRDISEYLKIPPSKIAKIETGFQTPDAETIGKLAEFYGISIDWLFGLGQKRPIDLNIKTTIASHKNRTENRVII
jgi:transcriptional regulator with XRE-family HTH domain